MAMQPVHVLVMRMLCNPECYPVLVMDSQGELLQPLALDEGREALRGLIINRHVAVGRGAPAARSRRGARLCAGPRDRSFEKWSASWWMTPSSRSLMR